MTALVTLLKKNEKGIQNTKYKNKVLEHKSRKK